MVSGRMALMEVVPTKSRCAIWPPLSTTGLRAIQGLTIIPATDQKGKNQYPGRSQRVDVTERSFSPSELMKIISWAD
jgi:hypothetical protein